MRLILCFTLYISILCGSSSGKRLNLKQEKRLVAILEEEMKNLEETEELKASLESLKADAKQKFEAELANCMHHVKDEDKAVCEAIFMAYFVELDVDQNQRLSKQERDVLFSSPIDEVVLPIFFPDGSGKCSFDHFCDNLVVFQPPHLSPEDDESLLLDFCLQEQDAVDENCADDWNALFPEDPDRHVTEENGFEAYITREELRQNLMDFIDSNDEDWDLQGFLTFMRPDSDGASDHMYYLLQLGDSGGLPVVKIKDYTETVNDCAGLLQQRRELVIFTGTAIMVIAGVITSSVVGALIQTVSQTGGFNMADFLKNLAVHGIANSLTALGCASGPLGCAAGGGLGGAISAMIAGKECMREDTSKTFSDCHDVMDIGWSIASGAGAGMASAYVPAKFNKDLRGCMTLMDAVWFSTKGNAQIAMMGGFSNIAYNELTGDDPTMNTSPDTDLTDVNGVDIGEIKVSIKGDHERDVNEKDVEFSVPWGYAHLRFEKEDGTVIRMAICECPTGIRVPEMRWGNRIVCEVEHADQIPRPDYSSIEDYWRSALGGYGGQETPPGVQPGDDKRYYYNLPLVCNEEVVEKCEPFSKKACYLAAKRAGLEIPQDFVHDASDSQDTEVVAGGHYGIFGCYSREGRAYYGMGGTIESMQVQPRHEYPGYELVTTDFWVAATGEYFKRPVRWGMTGSSSMVSRVPGYDCKDCGAMIDIPCKAQRNQGLCLISRETRPAWRGDFCVWIGEDNTGSGLPGRPCQPKSWMDKTYPEIQYMAASCPEICTPFSVDACIAAARALNLQLGRTRDDFAGNYATKGCYAHDGGELNGIAFFGLHNGNVPFRILDMKIRPSEAGQYRVLNYDCQGGGATGTTTTRPIDLSDDPNMQGIIFTPGYGR